MGGGLTMDGVQARRTLAAAERYDLALAQRWRQLYNWPVGGEPRYGPLPAYNARLGTLVRELCARHGLTDRLPRYILPGPLAMNKRIAEQLFLRSYDLELARAPNQKVWAYRRAAWGVDEWPVSVAQIYRRGDQAELQRIPGVGQSIAGQIAEWLPEELADDVQ
jgi:hypothetical protein